MAVYSYKAKTLDGAEITGNMEAVELSDVVTALREKNYYPVDIKEYKASSNITLDQFKKVTTKDISIFCKQYSVIILAGISILRGLEIVKQQTENPKLRKILNAIFEEVQVGISLSEAMKKHTEIPEMLANMVAVGEASGTLDKIMMRMSDYYEKEYKLKQKVKSALTYPVMVAVFALAVVILLIVKVLPSFVNNIAASGGELPLPTMIVMGISDFLIKNGIIIFILVVLMVMFFNIYIRRNPQFREGFDRLKVNMPLVGKPVKKIITARFARTFGLLISSGLGVIAALEICSDIVGNVVFRNMLNSTKEEIIKGGTIGQALEGRKLFPVMLTQMIKIGEESGDLDSVLEKTAEFYDSEVDEATKKLTTMLEPLIIVSLTVVVGFIILAMIMPMFSMYDAMSAG